jgi:hypothetical protein
MQLKTIDGRTLDADRDVSVIKTEARGDKFVVVAQLVPVVLQEHDTEADRDAAYCKLQRELGVMQWSSETGAFVPAV